MQFTYDPRGRRVLEHNGFTIIHKVFAGYPASDRFAPLDHMINEYCVYRGTEKIGYIDSRHELELEEVISSVVKPVAV